MASLDTNVLVRYLVRDDERQLATARRFISRCVSEGQVLFVPVTVALELEWVLRANYGLPKLDVVRQLSDLLGAQELTFESEAALELALRSYTEGNFDFSDCLHAALSVHAGHAPLRTFDRTASKIEVAALLT